MGNLSILITRIKYGGWNKNLDNRMIISNLLVTVWGLRMTIHIALRTRAGKEDRRFLKLRGQLHEAGGAALYYCVTFCGIFMTNGFVITVINASALYISMQSVGEPLNYLDGIGIVVWLVGFTILTTADNQLR